MKKTLISLALVLLLTVPAYADLVSPGSETPVESANPFVLILCIAAAVAAAVMAIILIRKKRSSAL